VAADHVLVTLPADLAADVGGVGGRDVRLGQREGRADLAREQGLEPCLLLGVGPVAVDDLHVAGVGRGARAPHHLGKRRVLEVRQAGTELALGQEEVPEALLLRPGLELLHDRRLPLRILRDLLVVGRLVGVDMGIHERPELLHQEPGLVAVLEVHPNTSRLSRRGR
jgi:hypothetical protein